MFHLWATFWKFELESQSQVYFMHSSQFIDDWEAFEAFYVEDLQTVQERGHDAYRERYSEEVCLLRFGADFGADSQFPKNQMSTIKY